MALSEGVRSRGPISPDTHLAIRRTDLAFLASICMSGCGSAMQSAAASAWTLDTQL